MSRADYAHWNEDADYMWWQEEGRFGSDEPEYRDHDDYDNYEREIDEDEDLCSVCHHSPEAHYGKNGEFCSDCESSGENCEQ